MIMEMLANPQNPWLVQVAKKKDQPEKHVLEHGGFLITIVHLLTSTW